ncbi:phosphonate ABC transporter, permease protein PhnE [Lactovum miscens]|uniref:Phosphonate transport system permease protein n=1 Tax=Lactovum miscens TaxID=190387 RepID=A0A841C0Y6_9LACT|nr:phosphonate ABC transporter, permease protein PhnE [Lactovum miscens]MBB5887566.1 phosphonate transport system permease protein [Lactovum miscens]
MEVKTFTLSNGKKVEEKRSKVWLYWIIVLILIGSSIYITQFDFKGLFTHGFSLFFMIADMFPPHWSYFSKVMTPLLDTIKMSFLGSIAGSILAIPFAVLAANNIVRNRFVNQLVRFILTVTRTFPTLVVALVATHVFGLGTFAGFIAIFIFTFSFVGKQMFENIETVDMGAFEATEALGVGRFKSFIVSVIPQVAPSYLSTSLYAFEGNVRYSTILGYVGAGGIGTILNDRMGFLLYQDVGTILLAIFVTVIIIELTSTLIRMKLA